MPARRTTLANFALRLLLALALVATGWSSRPLLLAEEAALEQFVLQGGSMADLCDETGAIGNSGSRHGHDCQTCCLAGSPVLLPERSAISQGPVRVALAAPAVLPGFPVLAPGWNAAAPRGPPGLV